MPTVGRLGKCKIVCAKKGNARAIKDAEIKREGVNWKTLRGDRSREASHGTFLNAACVGLRSRMAERTRNARSCAVRRCRAKWNQIRCVLRNE